MNIKQLDWNQYHSYIDKLVNKIKQSPKIKKYKQVAGIDPDAMLIAVHLSHKLSIPVITDINLLSLLIDFTNDNEGLLLVSNIVQTGNTFKEIMSSLQCNLDTAVLFIDKNSKFTPTFHIDIPEDRIYFPWQECGLKV